jgi:hypothetical protein
MFDHLPPMFPPAIPTCQIQWIDSHGNPTPDNHPAIGVASLEMASGPSGCAKNGFPICAHHLEQIPVGWSFYRDGQRFSRWHFTPYEVSDDSL